MKKPKLLWIISSKEKTFIGWNLLRLSVVDGIGKNQSRTRSSRKNVTQRQSQTRKYFYIGNDSRKLFGDVFFIGEKHFVSLGFAR